MGIIVLAVAILPLLGIGGSQIMRTETPGPMKDTKLTPRITETAKGLWLVYAVMTLACALVFKAVGMGWFDAVVHSFSTLSLGGFSSHDASFAYFNSPAIEAAAIFFMLIGGINFGTHFLAFRKLSLAPYRSDPEARAYVALITISVLGVAYFLFANQVYPSFWTALRELMSIIHPRAYLPVKLSGQRVENNIIFAVLAFMLIWGGSVVAMTMLLLASGLDIITAVSAVIVCICNTGPGLNLVGPATTYAVLSDFQTWVCTITMLIGRLELFTLFIVITPAFWRK